MSNVIVDGLLKDATVTVELAGLPPMTVSLATGEGQNPVMSALRPRITIANNASVIATVAPYGDPTQGFPTAAVIAVVVVGVVLWLALR